MKLKLKKKIKIPLLVFMENKLCNRVRFRKKMFLFLNVIIINNKITGVSTYFIILVKSRRSFSSIIFTIDIT